MPRSLDYDTGVPLHRKYPGPEIQQMLAWLCQWYGRCDGRRQAN